MQKSTLHSCFIFITLSVALLVAACGTSTVTIAGNNGGNSAATATPVSGSQGNPTAIPGGGGNPNPTATPHSGGGNPTVTPPTCADGNTSLFVHVATASTIHTTNNNSTLDSTYIDSCYTNGNPNDMLTIAQNWGYNGHNVYDTHAVGVWYDNSVQKWAIYNQDQSTMPTNVAFNVMVATQQNSYYFTLTANASNSTGDYVRTNVQDASFQVFVTQNFDPNGSGGHLNNHNVGVWYDGSEWAIYNEDKTPMQAGASFNVVAQPHNTNFDLYQVTAPATIHNNYSVITNALTDSHPTKLLFITHNWGDSSGYQIYYDYPMGVWYSNGHWTVFNEITSVAIPTYMTVNVLVQG